MRFGRERVSPGRGGGPATSPSAPCPQAGASPGCGTGLLPEGDIGGHRSQARGTLPGWTAFFFFQPQTKEKRQCEQKGAGSDPLAAAVRDQPAGSSCLRQRGAEQELPKTQAQGRGCFSISPHFGAQAIPPVRGVLRMLPSPSPPFPVRRQG